MKKKVCMTKLSEKMNLKNGLMGQGPLLSDMTAYLSYRLEMEEVQDDFILQRILSSSLEERRTVMDDKING